MTEPMPVLYLSHGGGPLPLLGEPGHARLVRFLEWLPTQLPHPRAIVVISAHWEAPVPTLTSSAQPPLLYDYYGFPEASYRITYPALGAPELARRIQWLLAQQDLPAQLDAERGLDHGVFVPLKLLYPQADIPCLQLSLIGSLDARTHLRLGQALAPLRGDGILVLGSGFSFHNMRALMSQAPGPDARNAEFQDWLIATCTDPALHESERAARLCQWTQAPHARYCHPREEHLLPLHVAYGAAGSAASVIFDDFVFGKRTVAFLWRN